MRLGSAEMLMLYDRLMLPCVALMGAELKCLGSYLLSRFPEWSETCVCQGGTGAFPVLHIWKRQSGGTGRAGEDLCALSCIIFFIDVTVLVTTSIHHFLSQR